jgi:O-antigen ligase
MATELDQAPRSITRDGHDRASQRALALKPASNRIASLLLFAVVMLAPLPFGSVDPLALVAWCMILGIALSAASLRLLDVRHLLVIAGVAIVVGAYLLVLHEQVAVEPFFSSSQPDPIWQSASDALGSPLPASVSLVRDLPILALGAPLAAVLCLMVSFTVCIDRKRARQLLEVVAWSGSAYAVYGIAAFLIDPGKVLWMKKQAYFTVLTSTFINRNTAAVYFGSCAIVWLLLLWEEIAPRPLRPGDPLRSIIPQALRRLRDISLVRFLALFASVVAMFLTGSRAGVLLSLLVGAFAVGGLCWKAIASGRRHVWILMTAIAVVSIIMVQLLGAGVIGRLDSEGLAGGGRLETYRSTLAMIRDHPWLGTGLGTFAWSYPAYRSSDLTAWGVWDRAHSTPIEIASDMGLPLAAVVIAGWAAVFAVLGYGLWIRNRDQIVMVAALAVASLGILHSLIDFSLQIPGFALVVFSLVGAGLAQSFRAAPPQPFAIERPSTSSRRI